MGSCNFTGTASDWENDGKDYAWMDNLTMMRGKHTFEVGVYANLDDKQQQPSWNDAGNFDFTAFHHEDQSLRLRRQQFV